jgi:hypothetical protein
MKSMLLRYTHPGSCGVGMIGALREGYRFLLLRKAGGSPYGA